MKINLIKENEKRTFLSHIVLGSISTSILEELVEDPEYLRSGGEADVILTVNGHELDLMKVITNWDAQMDTMIDHQCHKRLMERYDGLIGDKFQELSEMVDDLRSRISDEIDSRKADWEKDDV